MRVTVAAVGAVRDASLAEVVREFETRAARYWRLQVVEVRPERAESDGPGARTAVRDAEGKRLLKPVEHAGALVACDPQGMGMTSEAFASWLQGHRERATSVAFLLGGAYGLSGEVLAAARLRLALAAWTLPHEVARLVLAEQLYRAGTLVRREPYHK